VAFSTLSNLWTDIRSQVVKLLDKRGIQLTSVDLVRFRWTEKNDDQDDVESEEDEGDLNYDDIAPIEPVVDGTVYHSRHHLGRGEAR